MTATRVYDVFGMAVSSTGAWKGSFGHAGEHGYQEDSTGLQLLGHRYYDPSTGRFLTRDPIKDGRNWYGYCGNSPVAVADPTGLLLPLILAVSAVLIGIVSLVRLASDAGDIIDDAVEDKRNVSGSWGDDKKLLDRRRNDVPPLIRRTGEVAEDAFIVQYISGPIGEAGGDGVKVVIEGAKQVKLLLGK